MNQHTLRIGDLVTVKEINDTINFFNSHIIFFEEGADSIEVLVFGTNDVKVISCSQIVNLRREYKVIKIDENNGKTIMQLSCVDRQYSILDGVYRYIATCNESDLALFIFNGNENDCLRIGSDPTKKHVISLLDYRISNILWDGIATSAYYPVL